MSPVLQEILISVGKTFAVMAVGVGFRRFWGRDITPLNDLAMLLFVPCLAFTVILRHDVSAREFASIGAAALIVLVIVTALAVPALRLSGARERALLLPVIFMNSANLPFPILEANYGGTGLGYGVMFYVVMQTMLFSLGILVLHGRPDFRHLLQTPVFLATIGGIAFKFTGHQPPVLVLDTTELIGGAAIPLILFTFGYSLGGVRPGAWRQTMVASALRLGGGLVAGLIAVELLDFDGVLREVVILDAAMPSAVITVVLARRYEADHELVASVVFATTVAALLLIPILLIALRT